ncbi:MAG: RNB domain-containing ribonuclease, partial [Jiangellaceae bacterium]
DPTRPNHAALLDAATIVLRGAGYTVFDGAVPGNIAHSAIAAEYAHVTAPLRRLVDRYGLEICASVTAGAEVPAWVREALEALPEEMTDSDRRANAYESACVNLVEAAVMAHLVGQSFPGVVVDLHENGGGDVVVHEPAVQGTVDGSNLPLGAEVAVRLVEASVERRTVSFVLA